MRSTPLDDEVDVIKAVACTTYALFCVSKLALLKTMYRDSGQFILQCVSLFKDRAVCCNVYNDVRNSSKMLILACY